MDAAIAPERSDSRRWLILVVAAILALVVSAVLWLTSERRAVLSLPEPDRKALFEATRRTFQIECRTTKGDGLQAQCRERANELLLFPECDEACVREAREALRTPPR